MFFHKKMLEERPFIFVTLVGKNSGLLTKQGTKAHTKDELVQHQPGLERPHFQRRLAIMC